MTAIRSAFLLAVVAGPVVPATLAGQSQRNPVALDEAGRAVVSWGASARVRAEGWSRFAFGPPAPPPAGVEYDQVYGLARVYAFTRLDVADRFGLFVQVKSAVTTGRDLPGGDRNSDLDEFDVQQAYAQLLVPAGAWRLALTAGREDMQYGRERLVGVSDWANARRTFQGGNLVASRPGLTVKAFWARPVQNRQHTWNIPDSTREFFGVHAVRERPAYGVDAYWFGSRADVARFNSLPAAADRRSTVGARVYTRGPARQGRADLDLEAAYQFGEYGAADVTALLFALQAGWRPTAATRIHVGFDYGSGDDSTAGKLGTFNHLYPTAHSVLGYIDVHGRPNVVDLWGGATLAHRGTTIQVDLHNFWRASAKDGLYFTDGAQARPAGSGRSTRVGAELDLTVRRALRPNLPLQAGYSVYLPGAFLEQSGTSETMHFGYVQLGWTW